jgi:uncharacterized repeat protein (TIGR01451 family)
VTPVADVGIGKVGPASVLATSNLVYTISVTNFGPSSASSVVVTDTLPLGVTFVSASGGGANNSGVVNWTLGTLASGQVSNVTVTVTAPASGSLTNTASASSPTGDPNSTNNITPPVITTVTPVADVAIGKTGSASVLASSNLVYTISVTNFGPSSAGSVTVTDTLPLGVTFVSASGGGVNTSGVVSWSLGTLASGQVSNVTVTVTAPASGSLTNTAVVSSPTGDPNSTNNVTAPVVTTVTPVADVGIGKVGPASVLAASNLVYTISVTNFGPSSASSVTVTDTLPLGVTFVSATGGGANNSGVVSWTLGTLTSGQVSNVTVTVTAPASGSLTNVAAVSSPTGDPNSTNNITPPVITTVTPVADVSVSKRGPAGITFGTNFSYSISVTNFGPSTASSVTVTDSLPVGLVFVSSVPVTTTNASNQVVWSLGNLAVGATTNLTLNVMSILRGTVTNLATGASPVFDPVTTNNVSHPVITAITNIPPVANPDSYAMAENTTNTFSPLLNDLVQTPGGSLTIISVNPTNGTAFIVGGTNVLFTPHTNFIGTATIGYIIIDNVGGTNASLVTVTVTNRPPIANGQSVTTTANTPLVILLTGNDINGLPLTYVIVSGPANGLLSLLNTNTGVVTYTPNTNYTGSDSFAFRVNDGQANSATATVSLTILPTADVTVFKTGPASGVVGSNMTYTITVANNGPATATNVALFDQLPAGFTLVSATPTTAAVSNNLVSWPGFNLIKNATSNFTVTVVSAQSGNYTNIAFSTANTQDPNPTNNAGVATNSQVITAVTTLADVAVFKTGSTNIQPGGTLTYTITATNAGPSPATNVVVQDTLPANVTFQTASGGYSLSNNLVTWPLTSLAKGASTTFTVTVTAPASGSFVNIASAVSGTPDPNPTNNNGTASGSRVSTSVVPVADVQVFLYGPTNVTLGDAFFYTVVVTNAGPSPAVNTLARDFLPTNLVFTSASGGGVYSNGIVTWPVLASLASGQATNLIVNVAPSVAGSTNLLSFPTNHPFNFIETNKTFFAGILTNIASAYATTYDPNLSNNNGTLPTEQVQTVITPGVFSIVVATNTYPTNTILTNTIIAIGPDLFVVGTSAFNPQTGLYEETVTVTNIGTTVVHALRLYVGGLRSGVTLYNATGTNNGVPYVDYDPPYSTPLYPFPAFTNDNSVTFVLEFFVPDRRPFTNSLWAVAIVPSVPSTTNATSIFISQVFQDFRNPDNVRLVIGFNTVPGQTYTIEYSSDLVTWNIAVPSIVASANVTQWYDDGPPETISKPTSVGYRFYRVIQH